MAACSWKLDYHKKLKAVGQKSLGMTFTDCWVKTFPHNIQLIHIVDTIEEVVSRFRILFTYSNSSVETGKPCNIPVVERAWVKPGAVI